MAARSGSEQLYNRFVGWLRLNQRVLGLAMANKWLSRAEYAKGYDRVAASYEESWLRHIAPVTDRWLSHLPETACGRILDLGCGSGHSTKHFAERYPEATLVAVDLSERMLEKCKEQLNGSGATFEQADMLAYLLSQPDNSAGMVVSAWAIGYSHPARVIEQAGRVLVQEGTFAFIVNYADTLAPVFDAFRCTMRAFPEKLQLALWPRFPSSLRELERSLESSSLAIDWCEEGRIPIKPVASPDGRILPWLLQTGVLAGFDAVMPLRTDEMLAERFEQELRQDPRPIEHHYVAVTARCR